MRGAFLKATRKLLTVASIILQVYSLVPQKMYAPHFSLLFSYRSKVSASCKAPQVLQVSMAQKATKDLRDHKDPRDLLEQKVIQEARVARVSQGRVALTAPMDCREIWAPREKREILVVQDYQVPRGPLDLQDRRELATSVSVYMARWFTL